MKRPTPASTARAWFLLPPVAFLLACSETPTGPDAGLEPELVVVSGNNQQAVVGTMLPNALTVRVGTRTNPVAGALVNFVVTRGGGRIWAGSALTDSRGIAKDYWILGTRTDSVQRVEVRAVLPNGTRRVYGTFSATALADVPAVIERILPAGVTPELHLVQPAPGLRVFDRFLNPVPASPVVFRVLLGGGSVQDTVRTDAAGVALAVWTPGVYNPADSLARIRMRAVGFHPPVPSDSAREAQTRVYPVTGITLVASSGDGQTGPFGQDMTLCLGMRDSASAVVQPHPHHVPAVTWTRNGTAVASVNAVGIRGDELCYDVSPRLGPNSFQASIRGMAGQPSFTVTGT